MKHYTSFDKVIFEKSRRFSVFRAKCKDFLRKHGQDYDKFTLVKHDSEVGYISEFLISSYLKTEFKNIKVYNWENQFDM